MFETNTFSALDERFQITNDPVLAAFDDDDDGDDDDDDDDDNEDGGINQDTQRDANIFGLTTVFLEGRSSIVSREYTTFGGLTTEANLFVAQQYDASVTISISSASSITNSIGLVGNDGTLLPTQANPIVGKQTGEISQLDIEKALEFNRGLVLLDLTREQLVQVLEYGLSGGDADGVNMLFPQVTGLSFSYDLSLPVGQRVRSLAVVDDDGRVVDVIIRNGQFLGKAQKSYRIVTTDFLANGGDGSPLSQFAVNRINLTEVTVQNTTNIATFTRFGTEQDALAEYLASTYQTQPFSIQETTIENDVRIQNLSFRSDTVIDINVNQFVLVGVGKKDKIKGGNLSDFLRGKGGDDRMVGRDGDDEIFCDNGNDKAKGGKGNDTIHGGKGNDKLVGNEGDDILEGDKGNDRIIGSKGDDSLSGDDGNDVIRGATAAVRMISAWSGVRKENNRTTHWGEKKKERLRRQKR
jgi:Ca2+-binding RTX toxin-like protein